MPRRRAKAADRLDETPLPRRGRARSGGRALPDGPGILLAPSALRAALAAVRPVIRRPDDRRASYRVSLDEEAARVGAPWLDRAVLTDLSASGGGVVLPPDLAATADGQRATLELPGAAPIEVQLCTVRAAALPRSGRVRLGVRFGGLGLSELASLSRFLVARHREESAPLGRLLDAETRVPSADEGFVETLLHHLLVAEGRPLRVFQGGGPADGELRAEEVERAPRSRLRVRKQSGPSLHVGRRYGFAIGGEVAVCLFEASVLSVHGTEATLSMPTSLQQAGFRDSFRVGLGSDAGCRVLVEHPHLPGRVLDRPILEVSAGGFSFPARPEADLLCPGDRLAELRIRLPAGTLRASGALRAIAPHTAGGYRAGVELTAFTSHHDADLWNRFVFGESHPRLHEGPGASVADAWRALETSSYVSLWTSEDKRAYLASEYEREWRQLPRDAGHLLVLGSGERVAATCAGSRLYPRTWMVHHFGIDPGVEGSKRAWAREIYSGFLYAFQHMTALDFLVIYVEEGKGWNRLMYETFVARYPHPEDLMWSPFVVYRRDTKASRVAHTLGAGVLVDEARVADPRLAVLAAHLQGTLSPLEVEAHGFDADDVLLTSFEEECASLRYERTRRVFFAYERGRISAALVAETGGEGVNVFGLLNRSWVVPLGEAPPSEAVTAALLERAVAHYRAAGKQEMLLLGAPSDDRALLERLGFVHVSAGSRWLSHRRVLPAWLAYVGDVLGFRRSERAAS